MRGFCFTRLVSSRLSRALVLRMRDDRLSTWALTIEHKCLKLVKNCSVSSKIIAVLTEIPRPKLLTDRHLC